MAMLASKSPFPAYTGSGQSSSSQYPNMANYRIPANSSKENNAFFASPTESEFSEHYDGAEAIRYGILTCPPLTND